MTSYVFSKAAADDMFSLWEYIAKDDIDAADRVRDAVYDAISTILTFPGMGHRRADLRDDTLRVWPVFSYLIIYRAQAEPLEIVRVVSGYQDIAALVMQ